MIVISRLVRLVFLTAIAGHAFCAYETAHALIITAVVLAVYAFVALSHKSLSAEIFSLILGGCWIPEINDHGFAIILSDVFSKVQLLWIVTIVDLIFVGLVLAITFISHTEHLGEEAMVFPHLFKPKP